MEIVLSENHMSTRKKKVFATLYFCKESVYLDIPLWAELVNLNSGLAVVITV